jgi:hypothetical protein
MPLFTSSSDRGPEDLKNRRSIWLILVGIVIIGLACEAITQSWFHRASKINLRIAQEYRDVSALRPYSASGEPTMVLLGNSLLLEAVDYSDLKSDLAHQYDLHRLAFEQTEYLEQYYLLRTLLRNGSRPHYVVLCISGNHLIGDEIRGEFMDRYLDAVDVASLGMRRHLDSTTMSSQLFAHFSDWFANRGEIRKFVLGTAMPDVRSLTTVLAWQPAVSVSNEEARRKAEPRLREFKALCDQYGVRLIVLVPPAIRDVDASTLSSVAKTLDIPLLMPEKPGEMSPALFRDGFHLTPTGAKIFTEKVRSQLATVETEPSAVRLEEARPVTLQ